ncbi:Beta-xylosidase [Catalinimonas alkaloidigena]|uniref:Beta-xylosidase n=2 Tax=Catalinimonas alkaloidigena TaxID=1075417 RepID=A0A1G8WX80_9BACT|nr:Beta-xylosidase [Catalinimonas alkaloidigena]
MQTYVEPLCEQQKHRPAPPAARKGKKRSFVWKRLFLPSLFLLLLTGLCTETGCGQANSPVTYQNPVIAGDFADPSVIRVGDTYYAAGTSSEWGPAYPLYASSDLVNWQYIGPVFHDLPAWTMGSYWAPELFFRNGTFYVYYTARRKSDQRSYIGVATTTDLRQGFTDHGCLLEWTKEAIDAFVVEEKGTLYITWKAYGLDDDKLIQLLGRELTPDGLHVTGEVFTLLEADTTNWEAGGMEGQALFKHGDYYYMTYSGNACCGPTCNYQVGLARARQLQGPWEKFAGNPVLSGGPDWKCPGHGTVVTTADGRDFYLHHAYRATSFTTTGREGVLSELVWDEQTGWPKFRYGTTPPLQAASPLGRAQTQDWQIATRFDHPAPMAWVWDVSQPKPDYAIRKGQLRVKAPASATTVGSFLGQIIRKERFAFSAEVWPQAAVLQGVCVYGDGANALGLGVRHNTLELWQVKEGKREVVQTFALPPGKTPVTLSVVYQPGAAYQFHWQRQGEPVTSTAPIVLAGDFLPRWDRAPRVGIHVQGEPLATGVFEAVQLRYE